MEYKAHIEVATLPEIPNKDKGDLLEQLAADLLKSQSYEVTKQLRITGAELDLLCEHQVNQRTVYVECKAHRKPISSNVLTNLLGTLDFKGYQEGWLISTGPLGKEAKGFQHEWENKGDIDSQKLSIYTPERVIAALISAGVVKPLPYDSAIKEIGDEDYIGDPMLLVTQYGIFWTITCLEGGVPVGVLVYSTKTGNLITEQALLRNLSQTDTSQNKLDFEYVLNFSKSSVESSLDRVIEVEHGETWTDYRPARPEDFVGRKDVQEQIIHFLEDVREKKSATRVFAIKGDSGMGKSSLIAKLRSRVQNQRYRRKFFIYAVDVRAATGAGYTLRSVLACLCKAAQLGFGTGNPENLRITNSTDPLESPSIQEFLTQLEHKGQVICLVFDQFEELYSKPEVFAVFEAAKNLFLSSVAAQSNLVLGFAWKTDSTVQQDHPAYYMWHRLADHRMEVELGRFTSSEASKAISIFQDELGEKLRLDLRRQLTENSQGYPWLLKKLCIHVYDLVKSEVSQFELVDKALDVKSLFDKDLQQLTDPESTCLRMIAKSAPVDWYEILKDSGPEVLRGLQDKRLIVRSGDRLNLYWDIFREYVQTNTVPSISFSYQPSSPSMGALLKVVEQLSLEQGRNYGELSELCELSEKTIINVIRDLKMFDIATVDQSEVRLASSMEAFDQEKVLQKLRHVIRNHALTLRLSRRDPVEIITTLDIINLLKEINPAAQHQERTWRVYAERMVYWLSLTGYLVEEKANWKFEDQGKVNLEKINKSRKSGRKTGGITIFIGDTSPLKTIEVLNYLRNNQPLSNKEMEEKGFRNALRGLRGLGVVKYKDEGYSIVELTEHKPKSTLEIVWDAACRETAIQLVINYLEEHPTADGKTVGNYVNQKFKRDWSASSEKRIGNSLRQWGSWVLRGKQQGRIPEPPGRIKAGSKDQLSLFESR